MEVWFYLLLFNDFNLQKIFKTYYGFRVIYVFLFPSAGHWPLVSGRDKVGIRWFSLLIFELSFSVFLHYCGIRLSNVGSVIITSSILCCVCYTIVFWFYLVCLSWMRRRARDAHVAEAVDNVEQSFQEEALAPAPRHRGRDSSGRGVLSQIVFVKVWF